MTLSNSEISEIYKVSLPAVNAWIKNSVLGKNSLVLDRQNKKLQVIDNEHNRAEMTKLANLGRKFKSSKLMHKYTVGPDFYQIFSLDEQLEILNDLEYRHAINQKFMYKDKGAADWDYVYHHQQKEMRYQALELLASLSDTVKQISNFNKPISLVDLGAGNGYPAKAFLDKLHTDIMHYVPVDISKSMLNIAVSNVSTWYPKLSVKPYTLDIERTRLERVMIENKDLKLKTNSLLLLLGLTFSNQTEQSIILNNIRTGMQTGDLLIFDVAMEDKETLTSFKNVKYSEEERAYAWVFRLLGIDPAYCEIGLRFDEVERRKVKTYRLLKDYQITANILNQEKVIELDQGTNLIRWQSYLFTLNRINQLLIFCRLKMVNFSYNRDRSMALVMCEAG